MTDAAVILTLALLNVWQGWLLGRDRREWGAERRALLERLVPGLGLGCRETAQEPRSFDDEDEFRIERRRRQACGFEVDDN